MLSSHICKYSKDVLKEREEGREGEKRRQVAEGPLSVVQGSSELENYIFIMLLVVAFFSTSAQQSPGLSLEEASR